MKSSLFEYTHYKAFLNALIAAKPNGGRGQRKLLAEAIGCQVAYITHVLSGENHFSLEQAEASARYFSLSREETEFFLLLVQQNRAGTVSLRKLFDSQLEERRQKNQLLKTRLKITESLSREDQAIYYGSWHFAAIHVLLTIPEFRSVEEISARLKLKPKRVLEVLEFLAAQGLVKKELGHYKTIAPFLHLESDSPLIPRHHTNWRLRSIDSFDEVAPEELHYSLAFTIARSDIPKVREVLTQALESCAKIIRPSKEEELVSLCVDLFKV